MLANIRMGLDIILATAPQLPKAERWRALVHYIVAKILAAKPKSPDLRSTLLGVRPFIPAG